MKIRLKLLISISIFVLLYAAYYWGIPAAIDIKHKTSFIQNVVKKEMGIDIELKNPDLKMGLIPSVWVNADYFSIKDKVNTPLSIKKPKLKIRLLPLLIGKAQLAYFSCDDITARFKIDKNYRFYIGDYLFIKSSNSKLSIEDSVMDIGHYKVKLKDELQNKNVLIEGDYLNLEKFNSEKYIKFSTNTNLKVNNRTSIINADVDFKLPFKKGLNNNDILFDGTITNLNLNDFSPYVRHFSKGNILQINGLLNIQADTKQVGLRTNRIISQMALEKFSIIMKNKSASIYYQGKLNIFTTLDIAKNILKIKDLKIVSDKMNANIKGDINKIDSINPKLNLSLEVKNSRIENFISLLPAVNYSNVNVNIIALKKYGYYSDLEGKILIKGSAERPKITGSFLSTNGYIIKPLNIPKATVKLDFIGDKVNIDVLVPTGQNDKVIVKGPVDLYGDANVDLDISSTPNIDLETTEFILNPIHEVFYFDLGPLPIMKLKGKGNIKLLTKGNKKDPHLLGAFNFRNTEASFNDINAVIKNGEGHLYFKDKDAIFITKKALLNGKQINIKGKSTLSGNFDFDIISNGQRMSPLLNVLKTSPMLSDVSKAVEPIKDTSGLINLSLKIMGDVQNINDFKFNKNVFLSGEIKLLGNNVILSNLRIPLKNLYGSIKFKDGDASFDLYSAFEKSKLRINGKIKNNILHSKIKLDDIAFSYFNIPIKIFSGSIEIDNDKMTLYKINGLLDSMPILLDGFITNIFDKPNFNIYNNLKPSQRVIDKYINKNAVYPLKIKGDILYSSRISGTMDSLNAKAEINLQEDSSIYYMGSTIGDANDPIRIYVDTNIAKNSIYINRFQYDKLISSQNNREFVSGQLGASGKISLNKKEINLSNFIIRTQNPTDAKIFNILFKKPLIKQGLFSSNVVINGLLSSPTLIGSLNFTGIDIPLLDTTIKDISLDFSKSNIEIKTKGEIFSNKIIIFSNMSNQLTPPYVLSDLDIYLGNLDINEIVKSLDKVEKDTGFYKLSEQKPGFDLKNLVIKNAKLKADSVFIRNIFANNFTADFDLNEKLLFTLKNFKFDIADGNVKGDFTYNLLNSKSSLDLSADKVNANSVTEALFDLPNQIYGSLSGQVNLVCNSKTHKTCMNTLSGTGGFRVVDGRMPKLGSLEYLLKAANLVKSGVTGLTINSILDLVTPLKTGQFENINGNFSINDGVANSVQIFSRGKDLSLFITGQYNFATFVADMQVFGRISKKISNVLGTVGNTSLNTLFNTIPGLNLEETNKAEFIKNFNKIPGFELNDKTYRIFSAEIYGDINGDNYVQSFKWVE